MPNNHRAPIGALLLLLTVAGCKKNTDTLPPAPPPVLKSTASFSSFSFRSALNAKSVTADVAGAINDHDITVFIPYVSDLDSLIPAFITDAISVKINDVRQVSDSSMADFRHVITYVLSAEDGTPVEYKVSVKQFTALPILRVNTNNSAPINSTETYVGGTLDITANGTDLPDFSGKTEIRGRGNSTWGMPKKPYRIKLDKKSPILGMPTNKNWVLLANYSDKTLMRNKLAFNLGEWFGMSYSPRGQFVELFLNNIYQGSYFLTEQIKPDVNRVNITEMTTADEGAETITGGYLLEVDQRLDADHYWFTKKNVALTIKEPEAITDAQLGYINTYVQQMEDVLYSADFKDPSTGYQKYINDDTFIQWYWVNELFRNQDANFFSSIFLYKERNQKLSMGPLWDFDIAAGNINYNNSWQPTGWYIRKSIWISRLFEDPAFRSKAKAKWVATRSKIDGLMTVIDDAAKTLQYSQVENFKKWDILNTYVWPNYVVTGSYANEIAYLKNWLQTRITWIDAQLALEP